MRTLDFFEVVAPVWQRERFRIAGVRRCWLRWSVIVETFGPHPETGRWACLGRKRVSAHWTRRAAQHQRNRRAAAPQGSAR